MVGGIVSCYLDPLAPLLFLFAKPVKLNAHKLNVRKSQTYNIEKLEFPLSFLQG